MYHSFRRFIPTLLSLCAALTLLPAAAFAAEGDDAVKYAITVTAPVNGSVTVNGLAAASTAAGETVTVKASPSAGYLVKSVAVKKNGTEDTVDTVTVTSGNAFNAKQQFTFIMPAEDVTVSAEFEPAPAREITVSGDPDGKITFFATINGRTEYSASFARGYRVFFNCPNGYKITDAGVKTASGSLFYLWRSSSMSQFYFEMPDEDVVVTVDLKKLYAITFDSGAADGGRIEISVQGQESWDNRTAAQGDTVDAAVIIQEPDYAHRGITVTQSDGTEITPVSKGVDSNGRYLYSFTMPAADVTVTRLFEPPEITAALQEDGSAVLSRVPDGTVAFVYAASYDSAGRMTKLAGGELTDKTIAFSEKVTAGSWIFLLDKNCTPLCQKILLRA